ncbi:MAG: MerR family mercuric resistance operon transcriptional regulator [Brevundimonas sp.]
MALSDAETEACGAVRDLMRSHLELVDEKIADLERLGTVLGRALDGCEDGDQARCPVIEALGAG